MTPAERAEALFSIVQLHDGWAVLGPEGTYLEDACLTREEAEQEIAGLAAGIVEAIAAAERAAYERAAGVAEHMGHACTADMIRELGEA